MIGPVLAVYASGHGFGHGARMAALIEALRRSAGDRLSILVRSEAPPWLFHEADPQAEVEPVALDPGVLQQGALDLDLPGTVRAHLRHLDEWETRTAEEAHWLGACGAALVVADVPALAFAAAARAGVPALAVTNFGWDWILEAWIEAYPELRRVVARYREAYATAECLYRLPLHGEFPAFRQVVDVPHLVREARLDRTAVRRGLGVADDDRRPLVLVSFGGFSRDTLARATGGGRGATSGSRVDLERFVFAGFGDRPDGLAVDWRALPHPSPVSHPDLVAAADVVIGKTGYSTVAEVLAQRARFLYVPRSDYAEAQLLAEGLERDGCARPFDRDDFFSGRWRDALEAILVEPRPAAAPPCDGARVLATAILERL